MTGGMKMNSDFKKQKKKVIKDIAMFLHFGTNTYAHDSDYEAAEALVKYLENEGHMIVPKETVEFIRQFVEPVINALNESKVLKDNTARVEIE